MPILLSLPYGDYGDRFEIEQHRTRAGVVTGWSLWSIRVNPGNLDPSAEHIFFSPERWVEFVTTIGSLGTGPYGCTDWSARWCQHHGDCLCGDDWEDGEYSAECPLHSRDSRHAESNDE